MNLFSRRFLYLDNGSGNWSHDVVTGARRRNLKGFQLVLNGRKICLSCLPVGFRHFELALRIRLLLQQPLRPVAFGVCASVATTSPRVTCSPIRGRVRLAIIPATGGATTARFEGSAIRRPVE